MSISKPFEILDGHPVMAAGSPVGHIALWDLEEKKLMCQMQDAHSTAIAGMTFVPGEPLLVTNGADNALRVSYNCCCSLKPILKLLFSKTKLKLLVSVGL